ncbi:MAG TPA: hypothetical protein DEA08_06065 [Planctomycetes bacterium]|nr:hypothetical protein [Planctomycetota bacterium]
MSKPPATTFVPWFVLIVSASSLAGAALGFQEGAQRGFYFCLCSSWGPSHELEFARRWALRGSLVGCGLAVLSLASPWRLPQRLGEVVLRSEAGTPPQELLRSLVLTLPLLTSGGLALAACEHWLGELAEPMLLVSPEIALWSSLLGACLLGALALRHGLTSWGSWGRRLALTTLGAPTLAGMVALALWP